MRPLARWLALAAAGTAAACAQPDPPLLSLDGRACDAAPVMAAALPVSLGDRSGTSVKIGPTSPCLQSGGRNATYAMFSLPDSPSPYNVSLASEVVGEAVIAPRATIYDEAGTVTRSVAPPEFRATVAGYQTGLRLTPRDRFVLLAADPATLGQHVVLRLSARETGVQVAAAVPVIIFIPPSRVPQQVSELPVTLSLNGRLRVIAAPIARVP